MIECVKLLVENLHAVLTLILLRSTIWRAPTNASKWRMGFNSAFKGLKDHVLGTWYALLGQKVIGTKARTVFEQMTVRKTRDPVL